MKMKKILSGLLAGILICLTAFSCSAADNSLIEKFKSGQGGGLDYMYFAPESDGCYPLVIWLHGIASGSYNGEQVEAYDFYNWASDEYQSRFANAGHAYLLCPLAAGTWDTTSVETLKKCIDSFIARFDGKIDTSRIYITGFSLGASMVIREAAAYPSFFAACVPISSIVRSTDSLNSLKNMAVWFFANEKDTYITANSAAVAASFETLKNITTDKSKIRFTSVSKSVTPDGSDVSVQHYMWRIFTNDMFMADNSQYKYSNTEDGFGNTVTFTYPDGIISWLSQQTNSVAETEKTGLIAKILAFFERIRLFFVNLFS